MKHSLLSILLSTVGVATSLMTASPDLMAQQPGPKAAFLDYAASQRSSGVMVRIDGEVFIESYWDVVPEPGRPLAVAAGHPSMTADGRAIEDVASMQKSVVSLLVGIALRRGLLDLDHAVNQYLEPGWSSAPADAEERITLRHLLSMSSGLDTKLAFRSPAGEAWSYNTAAYNRLIDILEAITGQPLADLSQDWLLAPLGMTESRWIVRASSPSRTDGGYPHRFLTTARDLGLLGQTLLDALTAMDGGQDPSPMHPRQAHPPDTLPDQGYLQAMCQPSQALNPDYGFLFWLNTGRERNPLASDRLCEMVGARDRFVSIIPELGMVVVRLGDTPTDEDFTSRFWSLLTDAVNAGK